MLYEIRKDGKTFAVWTDPRCAPQPHTIKAMMAAGYRLYADGKPAKKSQRSV